MVYLLEGRRLALGEARFEQNSIELTGHLNPILSQWCFRFAIFSVDIPTSGFGDVLSGCILTVIQSQCLSRA